MSSQDPRTAKLTILLGFNGTGKTTMLKKILAASNRRCLVVTPDDIEWNEYPENELSSPSDFLFTGIQRHIFNEEITLDRLKLFKKGVVVFDDCRAYLKAATSEEMRMLLIRRRQRMVDVFVVGHGFTEVPPVFFTFGTDMILFKTIDNISRRKNCLREYEKMVSEQEAVNRAAAKNPHFCKHINL